MMWNLKWILLITFMGTIVCCNGYLYTPRYIRSSSIDDSQLNKNDSADNKDERLRLRNITQSTEQDNVTSSTLSLIKNIFIIGPEKDPVIFNTSNNMHDFLSPTISHTQADEAFINRSSSNEQQIFKVKRNPDGKLNVVFNHLLFSQKPMQAQSDGKRTGVVPPRRTVDTSDIIFPDQSGEGPKCLEKGKPFCTDVRNYPANELENILRRDFSKFEVFFGDDLPQENITNRWDPGKETLCDSTERIIYPKAALTKDSSWLYIVNHDNYTQGVRIEECTNPGNACTFSQNFPNGFVTTCEQHYIYRSLVAYNTNGTVVRDHFQLPSCCKCIVKSKINQ